MFGWGDAEDLRDRLDEARTEAADERQRYHREVRTLRGALLIMLDAYDAPERLPAKELAALRALAEAES